MKAVLFVVAGAVAGAALPVADAAAESAVPPVERLVPGVTAPFSGKGPLPRRETLLTLTLGAGAIAGEAVKGAEGVASLRFAETVGIGAGLRAADTGAGAFVRMDAIGLAINHWAFLGFADYFVGESWSFGGAMVAPVRRDSYLRLSIHATTDGDVSLGVGLEHDVW